jgi:hypothetical protein
MEMITTAVISMTIGAKTTTRVIVPAKESARTTPGMKKNIIIK